MSAEPEPVEHRNRRSSIRQSIVSVGEAVVEKIPNAYEREPVPETAFKGWLEFIGLFASRHTAGTEFAIGPLFVARGATALDVFVGLAIGNLLATLSWRYIVAPIAVRQRLTAYFAMERVVGRKLMYVYDLLAFLLLALLAGAMFTVSATAVGVLFNVPMPALTDWLPTSAGFCGVVIACGLVTTFIAAFGITFVTYFGVIVTPVLFAGIIFLAVRSLEMLGVGIDGTFWEIMNEKVYPGIVVDDSFTRFGMGHCIFFAWFCDLQLHIGQNDLSLLRYAKHVHIGWSSAAGMYVGHYCAWIVAGCMYAVQLQSNPELTSVAPGPIADLVGGPFGLVVIVIAGWSTANPVLYASGLGLQHAFPKTRAWASTLISGVVGTAAALFPGLTSRILEFLALAGLLLCPMGVILFSDFWVLPKLGIASEYAWARDTSTATNWPAVIAWFVSVGVTLPIAILTVLEFFFTPLLTIIMAFCIYVSLSKYMRRNEKALEESEESSDPINPIVMEKEPQPISEMYSMASGAFPEGDKKTENDV